MIHGLTLTQVSTLAACMTLATWTETIAINGKIWYRYSESKMSEDFPLLFAIPKRAYKNIAELAEGGFLELTKIGKDKYLCYTEKLAEWGKPKTDRKRTESPKTDEISPKTDSANNIYNNIYINNKNNNKENAEQVGTLKGTAEDLCLFANSKYAEFEKFAEQFTAPEFADIDIGYYWHTVKDWSSSKAKKKNDWIATARNFMRKDKEDNKLHTKTFDRSAIMREMINLDMSI